MAEIPQPSSPHEALILALERVDEMSDVLILWVGKENLPYGGIDSDLTLADALSLVEIYRHALLTSNINYQDH